jgi:hypothetical protein
MTINKTKLELTCIGKDNRPKLEPRISKQKYRFTGKGRNVLHVQIGDAK